MVGSTTNLFSKIVRASYHAIKVKITLEKLFTFRDIRDKMKDVIYG